MTGTTTPRRSRRSRRRQRHGRKIRPIAIIVLVLILLVILRLFSHLHAPLGCMMPGVSRSSSMTLVRQRTPRGRVRFLLVWERKRRQRTSSTGIDTVSRATTDTNTNAPAAVLFHPTTVSPTVLLVQFDGIVGIVLILVVNRLLSRRHTTIINKTILTYFLSLFFVISTITPSATATIPVPTVIDPATALIHVLTNFANAQNPVNDDDDTPIPSDPTTAPIHVPTNSVTAPIPASICSTDSTVSTVPICCYFMTYYHTHKL